MGNDSELPNLLWVISCFDRRRENPFPVYNRWYWLNWEQLTLQQTTDILAIVEAKRQRESRHSPDGFDETIVTMSIGSANYDAKFLKFRHLFTELPENDVEVFFNKPELQNRGFQTINVSTEYFEDETGAPISSYEMMQHVSGQEFPIIVGDPKSVLRLGLMTPVNHEHWTIEKANTIAQFLDVVQRIHASDWFRSPRFITSLTHKAKGSQLLEAKYPNDEDTLSVLAYFRQLHARDKLVVKACEAYLTHVGDDRKKWWVNERKQAFESLVDSPPVPYDTAGNTRREIVSMFMYGAKLLHSTSDYGDDKALDAFISLHGKHKAVMIFNSCLMDFFNIAATLHPVILQDYDHWVNNEGFKAANRVAIPDLFRGFTSPPHGTA